VRAHPRCSPSGEVGEGVRRVKVEKGYAECGWSRGKKSEGGEGVRRVNVQSVTANHSFNRVTNRLLLHTSEMWAKEDTSTVCRACRILRDVSSSKSAPGKLCFLSLSICRNPWNMTQ
jgi:hypothetical protein